MSKEKIDITLDEIKELRSLCKTLINTYPRIGDFRGCDNVLEDFERELGTLENKLSNQKVFMYHWFVVLVLATKNGLTVEPFLERTFRYEPSNIAPSLQCDFRMEDNGTYFESDEKEYTTQHVVSNNQLGDQLLGLKSKIATKPYVAPVEPVAPIEPEIEIEETEVFLPVEDEEQIEPEATESPVAAINNDVDELVRLAKTIGYNDISEVKAHLINERHKYDPIPEISIIDTNIEKMETALEQTSRSLGSSHLATLTVMGQLNEQIELRSEKIKEIAIAYVGIAEVVEHIQKEAKFANPFVGHVNLVEERQKIQLTDHVIVRYISRKFGENVLNKIRDMILTDELIESIMKEEYQDTDVFSDGFKFVYRKGSIVTCYKEKPIDC